MSSEVAETTSLLTNSPMENTEVSAAAVIDLWYCRLHPRVLKSFSEEFLQFIQFVILHAQTIHISWHITFTAMIWASSLNSKVAARFFTFVINSSTSSLAGSNLRFLQASKAAWVVLPSLANLLRNCHLKDFFFCSLVYLSSYLYSSNSSMFIVLAHHLAFSNRVSRNLFFWSSSLSLSNIAK